MSLDITKLLSEGKEVEFGEQKLRIKPLSVKEQAKFAELQQKNISEASEYLFVTTIENADPTLKREDILSINDREFINLVTKTMLEVNGLQTEENFPQESQQAQQKP